MLEQRQVTPVGDTQSRPCDFRVIAATNRDLARCMHEGTFRHDIYFRLAGFAISLAPLRERVDDIPLLAESFLSHARSRTGTETHFTAAAIEELCRRPWIGNARELRSAVEHAAIFARGGLIGPEHLPPAAANGPAPAVDHESRPPDSPGDPSASAGDDFIITFGIAYVRFATARLGFYGTSGMIPTLPVFQNLSAGGC